MGFFGDVGGFLGDVFTGRWTGGQTNVVQDVQQDPWVLAAPAAAIAAPFLAPAAAGAAGLGDLFGAGAAAAAPAAADVGGATSFAAAPELADVAPAATSIASDVTAPTSLMTPNAFVDQGFNTMFAEGPATGGGTGVEGVSAFTPTASAGDPGLTAINSAYGPSGGSGLLGISQADVAGAPTAPLPSPATANTAGAGGGGGVSGAWNTLTSPSSWTLPGVAQGAGIAATGGLLLSNLMKGNPPTAGATNAGNISGAVSQQVPGMVAQWQPAVGTANQILQQTPGLMAPIADVAKKAADLSSGLTTEAAQLRSYLEQSTLPVPQQAAIDQAIKNAKAKLTADYQARGMPTAPGSNTAYDQDIAALDRQGLIFANQLQTQLFQSGTALLQQGLSAAGMAGGLFQNIATGTNAAAGTAANIFGNVAGQGISAAQGAAGTDISLANLEQQQINQMNQAIANFATALGGGPKSVQLNLGGSTTKTS
jgi:hypothetical protein